MLNIYIYISIIFVGFFSIFSTFTNFNNNQLLHQTFKKVKNDNTYFFEYIKDSVTNNIPNLFYGRDASLPIQQFFLLALPSYFYAIENNHNLYNEFSIISLMEPTRSRFSIEAIREISLEFKNIDEINNTNKKYFNFLFYQDWDQRKNNFLSIINKINDLNFTSFDLIIVDLDFYELISDYVNERNDILLHILQKANKIIVISDGAAHAKSFVPNLLSLYQKVNIDSISNEQMKTDFELFKNNKKQLDIKLLVELLSLKNAIESNLNSNFNFIDIINYDSYQNTIHPKWNIHTYDTSFYNYGKVLLKNQTNIDNFLNMYSNLFIFNVATMQEVIINGYDTFNRNKRNAIFLGSSLFNKDEKSKYSRLEHLPNIKKSIQNQFDLFLEKFPSDQFNIIFKLHPVFTGDNAIEYVKIITNNKISNPIIINPSIPLESLIANDFYLYNTKTSKLNDDKGITNFIFNSNDEFLAKEWTTFFGLQPTTTTIHTTRLFYETSFNISKQESANLIPLSNFPIPTMFSTLNRHTSDNKIYNYYDENVEILNDIYKYYNPSIYFNDQDLINNDAFIYGKLQAGVNTFKYDFLIFISVTSIAIFWIILVILLIKRKKIYHWIKSLKYKNINKYKI